MREESSRRGRKEKGKKRKKKKGRAGRRAECGTLADGVSLLCDSSTQYSSFWFAVLLLLYYTPIGTILLPGQPILACLWPSPSLGCWLLSKPLPLYKGLKLFSIYTFWKGKCILQTMHPPKKQLDTPGLRKFFAVFLFSDALGDPSGLIYYMWVSIYSVLMPMGMRYCCSVQLGLVLPALFCVVFAPWLTPAGTALYFRIDCLADIEAG